VTLNEEACGFIVNEIEIELVQDEDKNMSASLYNELVILVSSFEEYEGEETEVVLDMVVVVEEVVNDKVSCA
jgi:hypothetical protein